MVHLRHRPQAAFRVRGDVNVDAVLYRDARVLYSVDHQDRVVETGHGLLGGQSAEVETGCTSPEV